MSISLEEIVERLDEFEKNRKEKAKAKPDDAVADEHSFDPDYEEDDIKAVVIEDAITPTLNIEQPNKAVHGAEKKFRVKLSKVYAFINHAKLNAKKDKCSVLPFACTSKIYLKIWNTPASVSNAFKYMVKIGLLEVESAKYQWGAYYDDLNKSKTYRFHYANAMKIVEFCKENGIKPYEISYERKVSKKTRAKLESIKPAKPIEKSEVKFSSDLKLVKPNSLTRKEFEELLYDYLLENYPCLGIGQKLVKKINETYYKNYPDLKIRFEPSFKPRKGDVVKKIGIRATNRLCGAVKDPKDKKRAGIVLRQDVISEYGFDYEYDLTASVPRISIALNNGGWVKPDFDLYKAINERFEPGFDYSDWEESPRRKAIKRLFFRTYFDGSDKELGKNTCRKMTMDGVDKAAVYQEMANLRRATEEVLGPVHFGNYVFLVESFIYLQVLHVLLKKGYLVWMVYDCFYIKGVEDKEEMDKYIGDLVYACYVQFKMANDLNQWEELYKAVIQGE